MSAESRGARSWRDARSLIEQVAEPLMAWLNGGDPVSTCPHLDGISGLTQIRDGFDVVVWYPTITRGLVCGDCYGMAVDANKPLWDRGIHPPIPCDRCHQPQDGLTVFDNTADKPIILFAGAFCRDCLAQAGVV